MCSSDLVSPVLCLAVYSGVNSNLLQEGLCHIQVCCTQNPCPCSSLLLTHTSTGDIQILFLLSLYEISGSLCAQGLFEPSEHLWQVWSLILNVICPSYHLAGASPLPLDVEYIFAVIQHFPVDVCSALSCNFGVLIGEDELTSFYSTIFWSWVNEWVNLTQMTIISTNVGKNPLEEID